MVRLGLALIALFLFFSCPGPDTLPPQVRIQFPAEGDVIAGTGILKAYATDNKRVRMVLFLVDDSLIGADSLSPDTIFQCPFSAAPYPAGSIHTLQAVAFDLADNCDSSEIVQFSTFPRPGTYHWGTISTAEHWIKADNPHYVIGTLHIEAIVTIDPGVELFLEPDARIIVGNFTNAGIRAEGTGLLPIRFTALDTLNLWQAIEFNRYTDPNNCIFRHCIIEFGGKANGLLVINNARLGMENCVLRHSGSAGIVCLDGGFTFFTKNTITGCSGPPLTIHPQSGGTIGADNRFTENRLNHIQIIPGTVERSISWLNPEIPYFITGTITVAGDSYPVLSIASACSLLFADSARLRVGVARPGGLFADGSSGQIVFRGINSNYWLGIEFWNNTIVDRTLLKNCLIEQAGRNGLAAIFNYAPVKIVGTRVQNSASAGIYCIGTGFTQFEHNTITGSALYPLHIETQYVGTMSQGNQLLENGLNYIDVSGGTITQDAVWHNHGAPYRLSGTIEVGSPSAPTLYISSGVELRFTQNCGLRIGELGPGKLIAIGIPDSIRFTGDTTRPGVWRAIEFAPLTSRGTVLDHCQVFFGAGSGANAEVVIRTCAPTITNNEIAWSAKYCIALFNSPIEPESLRQHNLLHHWGEGYDDIYEEGP